MPEAATDAEILWCLKIVVSSYSFGSCDGVADMFRRIGYVMFCSTLMENVKDSVFYAVLFDKSLKTIIQMGQMDLVANFWENVANKVCTCYLDSTAIDHA